MHDQRAGGDLSHIRHDLSPQNYRVIGDEDWIDVLIAEIATAKRNNHLNEIAAREAKGRWKEAEALRRRGPVDPWKFTQEGPLREGILTVNKQWFGGAGPEEWDPDRVSRFVDRGVEFLQTHFPAGQLREVTVHVDEEAVHLHFAVAVWNEKVSQNRGRQRLLQPSANPLLADYEHAQDLAGEAFLDMGIHRGERRAAAARAAKAAGLEGPSPRDHVPPSKWRREQRRKALQDAAKIKKSARDAADGILADAAFVSNSTVKKSRKRAVEETRQRQAEAEQVLVDARIARTGGQIVGAFRHIRNQRLAAESEALNEKMLRRKAQFRHMEERSHALAVANARAEADLIAAQQETEEQAAEAAEITAKAKAAEADALEVVQATLAQREAAKAEIAAEQRELSRAQAEVAHKDAELSAKLSKVDRLLRHLEPLLRRMIGWLKRPDLPGEIVKEGNEILSEAHVLISDPPSDPNAPQG
ncbi:hypothetical protein C7455_1207 [Roseicyclus mahoneyensis]|uniref:Plasmid recombination enzyme n=2 Tax=Roseicyclus mahoneyensis TaxID=164332 RepID=A0A316G2F0_9RHOB|nr:hypothetical protein C7455_1207 [Roseicyclus mahoneyensis]